MGEKTRYANTIDDMIEMIIQFGYVALFVMVFSLTPLPVIVNNVFEMKVDAFTLRLKGGDVDSDEANHSTKAMSINGALNTLNGDGLDGADNAFNVRKDG